MAGLQLSGLASGLDWQTLVDKLIAVERAPQDALRTEKALGQQKSSALDSLTTALTSLQDSLKNLHGTSDDSFAARAAKVADSTSGWSATAATNADLGSYSIQVTQLATKTQLAGSLDVGRGLSSTSDVSGLTIATLPAASAITAGEFTVNGTRIAVAGSDSLQDVLDRIGTATGGTVTASYDPTLDKVHLTSSSEIVLGSANDTSNLFAALGLYNNGTGDILPPKSLGVVSVSSAIANANLQASIAAVDPSGNGTFSINGVAIAYNVNTDSLSNVMARINASNAGVTATYDRASDRFSLTNKTTGDVGLTISEAPGGLLAAMGLSTTAAAARGKNALFSVDGGATLTSTSNTLDASVHGITGLAVTATSETTQAVAVSGDSDGIRKDLEDFITKYNAVQTLISDQTKSTLGSNGKVSASIFASNREITDIASKLRAKAFDAVPGLTGAITRLEGIGIDFSSGSNQLEIKDSGLLDEALANHSDDVKTLLSSEPGGVMSRFDTYISQITGTTGTLTTQSATLTREGTSLDEQIAAMDRRLAQQKTLLESGFIQMETAQSQIQSQLSALNNAFGTSK